VLVVAEPGMGKSSTTTQVALNTKLAKPTSWVVRINWNDHTRKLQEISTATFNLDSLVELLYSAAFTESKYTDIESNLLKQALQYSGNVAVLKDGFDEICPTQADKAVVILSKLMKTKVQNVWVTSRPVEKETIENKLHILAFSMKNLSHLTQENLFKGILKGKVKVDIEEQLFNEYVKHLHLQANALVYQKNFTGCPFYISIIANVFVEKLDISLRSKNIILPQQLNLLRLYDRILERKLRIYETEKKGQI
jgi:hypothetical protein